jgi:hypothetical protein
MDARSGFVPNAVVMAQCLMSQPSKGTATCHNYQRPKLALALPHDAMHNISPPPSTTVNSTRKSLDSRVEQLVKTQINEDTPTSLSGIWATRPMATRMMKADIGKVSRGLRERSTSASPASNPVSALPSWALQHPLSSMSTNQKQPAPLVRWLSSRSTGSNSVLTPNDSPSSSRPPSPALTSLNEALSDTILPAVPQPVQLPQCFPSTRLLKRPPPLFNNLFSTLPSTCAVSISSSIQDGRPAPSADSAVPFTGRISPIHSPPTRSSIDTLRWIHTSTAAQITPSPAPSRWWFQSDSESGSKESVNKLLNEEDQIASLDKLQQKCTSVVFRMLGLTEHLHVDRTPKSPVVFCHGLLGFDTVTVGPALAPLQVSHWRGIKEALEANGCEVLITRVPATSSPIDRAKVLEKKISEVYPGRVVHLIGHSMVSRASKVRRSPLLTHHRAVWTADTLRRISPNANFP